MAALDDRIHAAIATAMRDESEMVTRWVAVVEAIGEDGSVGCWSATSDGLQAWEAMGMYEFALARERASVARRDARADEGDE